MQIITAGNRGETAEEDPAWGHGAFTYKLLEELAARAEKPGSVFGATDLHQALQGSVHRLTSGAQTPLYGEYKTEGDFLFVTTPPASSVPAGKARLLITSAPTGAKIYVDDVEQVGRHTPATVEIDMQGAATKKVEIATELDGYKTVVKSVLVSERKEEALPVLVMKSLTDAHPLPKIVVPDTALPAGVKTKINPKDGAQMVFIPSGDFLMGDDDQTYNPRRKVKLSGYWMYKNDVTVGMYKRFCQETGRKMPPAPDFNPNWNKEDHPIVNVSWEDANAYCTWAGVRLPSEAQWEKAARGTEGLKYPWGNDFDLNKVWASKSAIGDAGGTTSVGKYGISPYGCTGMPGNVWQWCRDWYDEMFWSSRQAEGTDPENRSVGEKKFRVLRGGCWIDINPDNFRTADPGGNVPTYRSNYGGFRGSSQ